MMSLKKKALALAVAAAAVGGGVTLAQAHTVKVADTSLGQALIYPYMTAKDGWQSFLHVINTSGATVAAKVRFRAATDSADVLDFVVVLSPYDVWTGVFEQGEDGSYGFRPTDNSCTAPYGTAENAMSYNKFTAFPVQTSEVYAEVIMMGATGSPDGKIAKAAKHGPTGVPSDCQTVSDAFQYSTLAASMDALAEFEPGGTYTGINLNSTGVNYLTGKFDLVHVEKGWSGAARATVLQDFGAPGCAENSTAGCTDKHGTNSMTGPMFINTNMWQQTDPAWDHPTLAEGKTGLQGTNAALAKTSLINEWVLNPNLGELSPWIVTFPTKKLILDGAAAYASASNSTVPSDIFGTKIGTQYCVPTKNNVSIWNREESMLVSGGVSPGNSTDPLCYEANVINFTSGTIDSSSVLNSSVAITLPTTYSTGVLAGWMKLTMQDYPYNRYTVTPSQTSLPGWAKVAVGNGGYTSTGTGYKGMPVVGFNLTARSTPSDTVLYEHAYTK